MQRGIANTICLLFLFFSTVVNLQAQNNSILNKQVSFNTNELYSQAEVIAIIKSQTNTSFSYKSKIIQNTKQLKMPAKTSVKEAMQVLVAQTQLDFVVINNVMVVKPTKEITRIIKKTQEKNPDAKIEYSEKKVDVPIVKAPEKFTLSGKVQDSETNELVLNALVAIPSLGIEVFTNEYGYFSITIPPGNYTVVVNHPSIAVLKHDVSVFANNTLQLQVEKNSFDLHSNKTSIHADSNIVENSILIHAKPNIVDLNAVRFGLNDPMRDLETMPGIQMIGDASTNFRVRGGSVSQNMVVFDDAPVFNPTHLFGLYSMFVPSSIQEMTVYKNEMPAEYGGKLSSYIDIRSRDGNKQNVAFFTEFGPLASTLSIETPIVKNKASAILSTRFSNLKWLEPISAEFAEYSFYDTHFKISSDLGKKHKLYLSLFWGGDVYNKTARRDTTFGVSWQNLASSLRWNYIISPRWFTNFTIYAGSYNYFVYPSMQTVDYWNSQISSVGFKYDITHYKTNDLKVKFGVDASGYEFNPGNLQMFIGNPLPSELVVSSSTIGGFTFYYSREKSISEKAKIMYGARMPLKQNNGPSEYFVFDNNYEITDTLTYAVNTPFNGSMNFEPRIIFSYQFNKELSGRFAYTKTTQDIHLISNTKSEISSLDFWLPNSPNINSEISRQINTGYKYTPQNGLFIFASDLYYKVMNNQIDYANHAKTFLNSAIEGELRFGKAASYGIENSITYKTRSISANVQYTYSRAFMKINDINQNKIYSSLADRPHDFSLECTWYANKRLFLQTKWLFLSGKPVTTPTSYYEYQGTIIPIYSSKHNNTLPNYHRLDFSAQYRLNKKIDSRFTHLLSLSILNLYARKNPVSLSFNKIEQNGDYVYPTDIEKEYTYITTFLHTSSIIPTITYAISFK